MVLGQPTPLFSLAVTEGLGSPDFGDVEFIVANKRPMVDQHRTAKQAYNLLVRAFGVDDELFTRERALDVLSRGGLPNQGTFLFNDLLEQDSIALAR